MFFKMNGCRHSAQTLIKDGMQRVGLWRFFWGRHRLARGDSGHPFFVDASSGRLKRRTHLPVRPYIACPCIAGQHASPRFLPFPPSAPRLPSRTVTVFFRWCFLSAVFLFLFPMAATILAVSLTPWGATLPVVLRPSPSFFRSFPHPRFPHTYLLSYFVFLFL